MITKPYKDYSPEVEDFLLQLRKDVLKVSIDELVTQMGWETPQYYQKIVNGYTDKNGEWRNSIPTIDYLFGGLFYAMDNEPLWWDKKEEINKLIIKHFVPTTMGEY